MAEIIASTYEIIEKLGSGGGGNVFLAKHLRLGKNVVLKADKRKSSARSDILRREVDVLKELHHSYIPQVYDFFVDNETVYTVMDFIEGESLDRPLKRGEKFAQPQVVKWAIQLLQALSYLHSPTHGHPARGYVHSDIKPANIMRTPNNDICLIDFNIALALGEENVIGCSAGYASPEHYGLDYSSFSGGTATEDDTQTKTLSEETSTLTLPESKTESSEKRIAPDARSDIYSLGATLYHLLSGKRPEKDACSVKPLSRTEFSPQIVEIILKAMNPNPDLRFQSADEMLYAFLALWENDPRVLKQKKKRIAAAVTMAVLIIGGLFVMFVGLKRMQTTEQWLKLAEYSQNSLSVGDKQEAIRYALQAYPEKNGIFTPKPVAAAQKALTDATDVYALADTYQVTRKIELPSEPLFVALSPDGKTAACIYAYSLCIFDTDTGETKATLPASESALAEARFAGNNTILFAAKDGVTCFDIAANETVWVGAPATAISISEDLTTVAAVNRDEDHATVYELSSGRVLTTVDFGGRHQHVVVNDTFANPHNNLLALSPDGKKLGVSFDDGSLQVFNLEDSEKDLILFDPGSGYIHFEGGFFEEFFAFSAYSENNGGVFAVIDTVKERQTGGFHSEKAFGTTADSTGIYVQTGNILVRIDPVSGEQTPMITHSDPIRRFACGKQQTIVSSDHGYYFFDEKADMVMSAENEARCDFLQLAGDTALVGSMDAPGILVLKYISHKEANVLSYEASFTHNEARISADRKTVMLFSFKQFRLYDLSGNLIAECEIPDADHVYDQQYRRDERGSRLEVTYYDGHIDAYSAETGELIEQTNGTKPDTSLTEEFLTDEYRIVAPLHGAAVVYSRKSGKQIKTLAENANLTYITQIGNQIVAQYITADGTCYGQLLDENLEVVADLPYLCDVFQNHFFFDYPSGNVRESEIYDIAQLLELAKKQLED